MATTIRSSFMLIRHLAGLLLALFGHDAMSELSLLSGVKRKLDFEPAKGSFWRILLQKSLRWAANRDSVLLTRIAARSIHDGPSEG